VIDPEEAMIKINRRNSFLRPLLSTALPFGLLVAGAISAHAGSVTVTGANGQNYPMEDAGGAATATTTTPSDPSNTATATGGNGGAGGPKQVYPAGVGAAGGAASATATTSIGSGAASAEATSFGGAGGRGGGGLLDGHFPDHGGAGGAASSSAAASSVTGSATATASSTGGTGGYSAGRGGAANSNAAALSTTGSVSATASSTGGGSIGGELGGSAAASSNARNSNGAAVTTASAPVGVSGSALTTAAVGSGSPTLVAIVGGEAVSNAILTPSGPNIGIGAMSAAYGYSDQALQYTATAVFDFTTTMSGTLDLNLLSDSFTDNSAGIAFDSVELEVVVDGGTPHTYNFTSLTGPGGAESFFNSDMIDLGAIAQGSQSVEIEYFLNYNSGTSAAAGDGFGFTYALVDPPAPSVPEPSTWAMMAIGFASLAFAGYRRSRMGGAFAA
jgi:PEP-CTERM motif